MSKTRQSVLAISIFMISTLLISACTQSLSAAPVATPTLLPTGLFVSPIASVENPMAMIEEFARQTAAAQTATAGTPGTPQTVVTGTPGTPQANVIVTTSPTLGNVTPTNVGAVTSTNAAPAATSVPGIRPAEYILKAGEFPYCIARRFNVDPEELIKASGLINPDVYYAGLRLVIPQSGSFPENRSLIPHPAQYVVASSDETVYSIACKYGDVHPEDIAAKNNISVTTKLTVGQSLQIP